MVEENKDSLVQKYMSSPTIDALVQTVEVTDAALVVQLSDGRQISVPITFYPRLIHGTPEERAVGIDWTRDWHPLA